MTDIVTAGMQEIVVEEVFPHSLEAVWKTLTTGALIGRWLLMTPAGFEPIQGKQNDDWTIVLFTHHGWREPVEFMHHCSTKWGEFLLSLKSLLETGKGGAWPNEVKLDSWE